MPIISWSPSTSCPARSANADDVEMVSASATSAMPTAPATSTATSDSATVGIVRGGKPFGSSPTSDTPRSARSNSEAAAMESTTMTSTAGALGSQRWSTRTTTIPLIPTAAAAGTALPSATPRTNAPASASSPFASTLKPNSFGSCPTTIVTARPFM